MKKVLQILLITLTVATLSIGIANHDKASADQHFWANPSTWFYDEWHHGTWGGKNHSDYQVTDTRRIGAMARVNNGWNEDSGRKYDNYNWAKTSVPDRWWSIGQAYWAWYWF